MNKASQTETETQGVEYWLPEEEGWKGRKVGKGDRLYGDGWKPHCWSWSLCKVYRNRNIVLYT